MMRKCNNRICHVSTACNCCNAPTFNNIGMCIYLKEGFLLRITTDNMKTYSMVTESMTSNSKMTTNSMMKTDNVITSETNKEVEIGMLTETCNKGVTKSYF